MSGGIYYPYTKKQAIDIVARYYGISQEKAKKYLEKTVAYRYGKAMKSVGELVVSMEVELQEEAKKSFYED